MSSEKRASESSVNEAIIEEQMRQEARIALREGGVWAAVFGFFAGGLVTVLILTGVLDGVTAPCLFAYVAGGYSLAISRLAGADKLRGAMIYIVFLPFVSLPTALFLLAHLLLPGGAASYITGPFSYLYFVMIFLTGFIYNTRLSLLAGLLSAGGYLLCFALAREQLQQIHAADPTLLQDLTAPALYATKGVIMAFSGALAAALVINTRRLILKSLAEKESRLRISTLFGQYVSDEVKDRIIDDEQEALSERVKAAVLFSDLRGFSTYSEHRAPEEIVSSLNAYFDSMVKAIQAEGGVIDKFIGDAVMAVFGGVGRVEAPCAAALRAARRMREGLRSLNATWSERGLVAFDHGIGIDFGEVLQGPIGSDGRKEFTVIGDPVNTASRVEGLTKRLDHHVILTEGVYRELPPELVEGLTFLGEERVKGREKLVRIYGDVEPPC